MGWCVNCRQFSQVNRSGQAEKRVCIVFVNQWAANGEKQDEVRKG